MAVDKTLQFVGLYHGFHNVSHTHRGLVLWSVIEDIRCGGHAMPAVRSKVCGCELRSYAMQYIGYVHMSVHCIFVHMYVCCLPFPNCQSLVRSAWMLTPGKREAICFTPQAIVYSTNLLIFADQPGALAENNKSSEPISMNWFKGKNNTYQLKAWFRMAFTCVLTFLPCQHVQHTSPLGIPASTSSFFALEKI